LEVPHGAVVEIPGGEMTEENRIPLVYFSEHGNDWGNVTMRSTQQRVQDAQPVVLFCASSPSSVPGHLAGPPETGRKSKCLYESQELQPQMTRTRHVGSSC